MGCFSAPKTQVQQASTLTPKQNEALSQMLGLVQPQLGQADQFQFGGNRVAGLGGLTQGGLDILGQTPEFAGGLATQGAGAIGNLLDPMAQGGSLDAIFGRGQTMFGRESERIANKFGAMNATSSSGARDAQNRALEQFTLASQAQAAPFALQSQQLGLGALPGVASLPGQAAGQMFQGGGIQQGQQQALINEQIAAAQRQNPLYNPAMASASQLVGFPAFENLGVQQGAGLGRSLLGGGMGILGQAAGAGGGIMGNIFG